MERMKKKAVFFSIISIFIVLLFVASSKLVSTTQEQQSDIALTRTRVKILNSIVQDMESDYFEKMLYVASKNTLVGVSDYYYGNHGYNHFYQMPSAFQIINTTMHSGYYPFIDPAVDLTQIGCAGPCMNASYTMDALVNNLTKVFDRLGMSVDDFEVLMPSSSYVRQTDPFHIKVKADIKYNFRDKAGVASWQGRTTKEVEVSVYGMHLPYGGNYVPLNSLVTSSWGRSTGKYDRVRYDATVVDKMRGLISTGTWGVGICGSTEAWCT